MNYCLKITFVLFISLLLSTNSNKSANNSLNCNDPFFNFFNLGKVRIFKDVLYYSLNEMKTYKPIYIYKSQIGMVFTRNNKVVLKIFDIRKGKEKDLLLEFVDGKFKFEEYPFVFGFNSKFILIFTNKNLFLGDLKNKIVKLKKIKEIDIFPRFIKVFEESVILVDYGYRSKKTGYSANTFFYTINLNNFEVKYVDLGVPKGFYFTLFYPPEVVDVSDNYIAHSEVNTYRIKITDKEGKLLYEITKKDDLFNEIDNNTHLKFVSLLENEPKAVKPALDSMRSTFFGGIGIIEKVNFISDSLLLVRWYGPKTDSTWYYPEIYYDIWKIEPDTAFLIAKNILAPIPNDTILMGCYPLYTSRFESGSEYIVAISSSYSPKPSPPDQTFADYMKSQKKYENNNPLLKLIIYEWVK